MLKQNKTGLLSNDGSAGIKERMECFRCGVCCTKYQVNLDLIEAHNLADKLGVEWDSFIEECTDPRWPGTNSLLLKHVNGACIFLRRLDTGRESTCSIQSFKPLSCAEWSCSQYKPDCREGLSKLWGLTIDALGRLKGEAEKIKCFRTFQQSLKEVIS